jgi:hypothetical protein
MERRMFLAAVAGGLLAAPLTAEGQPAEKLPTLGILAVAAPAGPALRTTFLQALRDLGWAEDQVIQ